MSLVRAVAIRAEAKAWREANPEAVTIAFMEECHNCKFAAIERRLGHPKAVEWDRIRHLEWLLGGEGA